MKKLLPAFWLCVALLLLGKLPAQTLVHYWNFNNSVSEAAQLTPTLSLLTGASFVHIPGGISAIQITSNTGQGFDVTNPNARNSDPAGTHLRFNDPIGGGLLISLPTTGYQQVVVKYGTRRSGSGAGAQKIEYSTNGTSFDSLTTIFPVNGNPIVETLDFSAIPAANNNPDFKIRITFSAGPGGTVGNNRFDNFTLDAIPAGADLTPPVATLSPADGAIRVPVNTLPEIQFNEPVRLISNAPITAADIPNIVALRLDSAAGAPVAFSGSVSGNNLIISPTGGLLNGQRYYFALLPNTVEDTSDNSITTAVSVRFTTLAPQTQFQPGDMVPVAYRTNATATPDEVALLTFVNILPGTLINLTDAKYTDNAQPQCPGGLVWESPNQVIPAGSVIYISTDGGTASQGTLSGATFGLSSGGDQVIVYTGTAAAPSYVTALSSNAWVSGPLTACGGSLSKLPAGLADGLSSINLSTAPGNIAGNTVNAYYNGPQSGTTAALRASVLDPANWVGIGGGTPPQVWPAYNFPGPPQVNSAVTLSASSIQLVFNSDLDSASAVTLANYTGVAGLQSASVTRNGALNDTVTLSFNPPFVSGVSYSLTVSGIVNSANLTMLSPFVFTFNYNTSVTFQGRFVSKKEDEGFAQIRLNVTNPSPQASVTLSFKTGVWSTASLSDFGVWPMDTTLILDNTVLLLDIPVNDDLLEEQDEYGVFRLENPTGAALSGLSHYTVYIRDNDRMAPQADKSIELEFVSRYTVPRSGNPEGIAEIVAYDSASQRLFTISTGIDKVDIVDFSNPLLPTTVAQVDMTTYGAGLTSVAVRNGIVAVSVTGLLSEQDSGSVVFFDTNGTFLKQLTVGALPDMVVFTPDGKYVMTANEGQPNDAYTLDPEGSVSLIDISGGIATLSQANVNTLRFTAYNSQATALQAAGVRILKSSSTVAQDFEPEYITVAPNSQKAWVVMQENNAIAEIDLVNPAIAAVWPLGAKNYNSFGNGYDASDQGGFIHISNWPVKGFFLPDALANYEANGVTYLITANEGDEKEYAGLNERTTVGAVNLDSTIFPNAAMLKENHNLGRFRISNLSGDTDNDGDYDELYCVGSRSFSIWNAQTGALVYDSGDAIERITAADTVTAPIFNADNTGNALKGRSRAKGPEPEGLAMAHIGGKSYAFVGLERIGGVMTFDVSDPANPIFSDYQNTRSNSSFGGDNGTEGLLYISGDQSPNGKHYVISANEVSGTLAIFEVKQPCNFALSVDTLRACAGDTITLDAGSGFASYAWSNGANSAQTRVTTPGIYRATAANFVGCRSTDSVRVIFDPLPVLALANTQVCDGDSATLDAGAGFAAYRWSNGATTQKVNVALAGSYRVTVSNSFGCSATDSLTLTVNPLPTLLLRNVGLCAGDTVILDAGAGFVTYRWSDGASTRTTVAKSAGTYTVTVTNSFNCAATDSLSVLGFPAPVVRVLSAPVCPGGQAVFDAGSGFATYTWSIGTNRQSIRVTQPGVYCVTVTDNNGCSASSCAQAYATVAVTLGPDTTVFAPASYLLKAGPGSFANYLWNDNSTGDTLRVMMTGSYWVIATDTFGCVSVDTVNVAIIPLSIDADWAGSLQLWPNPSRDVLNIGFEGLPAGFYTISLSDLQGKTLHSERIGIGSGQAAHTLDLSTLPAGSYLLSVQNGSKLLKARVLKQ